MYEKEVKELKGWMRISADTNEINSELEALIAACRLDLKNGGVNKIELDDPLIMQAVKLYAKANFGYMEGAEKFMGAYEALKCSLALSGEYAGGA